MTFSEIAEETKVSRSQVRRWARASLFPVLHLGHKVKRVRREEYENFRVGGLRLNENKIDDTEYGIHRHIPKLLYEGRRS